MTTASSRSRQEEQRIRAGLSQAQLARRAGVSTDTVRKALSGQECRPTKTRAINEALRAALEEKGVTVAAAASQSASPERTSDNDVIEIEIGGNFGVNVVLRGPVTEHDALEGSAVKLIRQLTGGTAAQLAG